MSNPSGVLRHIPSVYSVTKESQAWHSFERSPPAVTLVQSPLPSTQSSKRTAQIDAQPSLFQPNPAKPSLFQPNPAHSNSFQPNPAYSSPIQPIPAYSSPIQLTPTHSSPIQPIPAYSSPIYLTPTHSSPIQTIPAHFSPIQPNPLGGRDSDGQEEDSDGGQCRDALSHLPPGFARHVEHQKCCREQSEGTFRSRVKLMEMFKWH
ncbi:hypothetical protein O3P69_012613 [Scylla paramamosain]|uniref:Uncharacterized protein n=1 Tax=Scylla paramamosain TaxID=85552 RepID=A0AAW0SEU1_SCYPA